MPLRDTQSSERTMDGTISASGHSSASSYYLLCPQPQTLCSHSFVLAVSHDTLSIFSELCTCLWLDGRVHNVALLECRWLPPRAPERLISNDQKYVSGAPARTSTARMDTQWELR